MNGSEKRIKELKTAFDSPDRYGKGLVWDGYTVHDASNVFRRYLNDLPEPVVPLDLYQKFRDPLRGVTKHAAAGDPEGPQFVEGFDEVAAIKKYQQLITELPPLNRQLLLYILDLLAVFAAKSELNRMNSQNLAAIFQPGMLSHPEHAMAPEEYRLNQYVLIFLIENQDHFLIGMQGTAADEKTKLEVEQGTPTIEVPDSPSTPTKSGSEGLGRTASNASAAAVSVRRDGMIRRNRSTASRHSRHDSTGAAPTSPANATTPTGSLARSNTLPSKKSPALPSGRFQKDSSPMSAKQPRLSPSAEKPATRSRGGTPSPTTLAPSAAAASSRDPARSQEKLVAPGSEPASTPVKERNLQSIFQRSPNSDVDRRPRNKLKKRAPPGGGNRSAQSSTASLPHSNAVSPRLEPTRPADPVEAQNTTTPVIPEHQPRASSPPEESSEPTPRGSQVQQPALQSENSLRPNMSPPTSLHSSANEGSELGQIDEPLHSVSSSDLHERERRKRWRISRGNKKEESTSPYPPLASPRQVGSGLQAESTTSVASGSRPRRASLTNDSSEVGSSVMDSQATPETSFQGEKAEGREEKGPIGWIKHKYREAKETHEQRRNKSPPGDNQPLPGNPSMVSFRGKSLDMKREEGPAQAQAQSQQAPQAPAQSAPPVQAAKITQVVEDQPKQAQPAPVQGAQSAPPAVQKTKVTPVLQDPAQPAPAQRASQQAPPKSKTTPVAQDSPHSSQKAKIPPAVQDSPQAQQAAVQGATQQVAAQSPKITLVTEPPLEAHAAEVEVVREPSPVPSAEPAAGARPADSDAGKAI